MIIPEGIEVKWFVHPHPHKKSPQQLNFIKTLDFSAGVPNIFIAGELSTIREIRSYIAEESGLKDAYLYISSYCKVGLREEEHKEAKKSIAG